MRNLFRFILVLAVLLAGLGIAPQVVQGSPGQQGAQPTPWAQIFLPFLFRPAPDSLTGRVIEINGQPLKGVSVVDNFGNTATTDANGYYNLPLKGQTGELVLSAEKENYYFTPSMVTVDPQSDPRAETILAVAACSEVVSNGSFTDDSYWVYPPTPATAGRVTNAGHTDSFSARTGILSGTNRESYSSVRSPVINLPASVDNATLRLWLYPIATTPINPAAQPRLEVGVPADSFLGETPGATVAGDLHYVLLLDQNNNVIDYLFTGLRNDQQWTLFEFDLSRYAGRQVKIQAGTYNDGAGGLAAMYVDDISYSVCTSDTPTTPPGGGTTACTNYFGNSSFETNGSWNIPITEYSAAFSTDVAQDGVRSMRTGITNPAQNRFSYSDAYQSVFIPATATSVKLTMYIYPQSTGASALSEAAEPQRPRMDVEFGTEVLADDAQYVLLLDSGGFIIDYLFWTHSNSRTWTPLTFDLTAYRGRTLRIQFGTFNNGVGGATSMYVDSAVLDVCTGTGPTSTPLPPTGTPLPPTATPLPTSTPLPTPVIPTPTPQPGICSELISNNGFEQASAWTIPLTAFSAGYSNRQAHTGVQSMRTGIVFTAHDRFSYSDFRQTVTIPSNASSANLNFWLYAESEEVEADATSAMVESPTGELNAAAAEGHDVQYVLILDRNGYWIDTLLWIRSNEQTWINRQFDLSAYRGQTISIQFGTFNDGPRNGVKRVTSMFVDDVTLQACP